MHLKAVVAVLMLSGSASAASAQASDPLQACSTIINQKARLDCYDGVARSKAPVAAGVTGPTAEPSFNGAGGSGRHGRPGSAADVPFSKDPFGSEAVHRRRADEPVQQNQIAAHIVSVRDNGIGHWLFTLDTGAVWQMTEAVHGFQPPRKGATVRIRRGTIGSFFLDTGHQAGVRIVRIR